MLYVAITIAQIVEPLRVALVILCMAVTWTAVAPARRFFARAVALLIIGVAWSAYLHIAIINRESPLPRDFVSETVRFLMVTVAGLVANSFIASVVWGCSKLFRIGNRGGW